MSPAAFLAERVAFSENWRVCFIRKQYRAAPLVDISYYLNYEDMDGDARPELAASNPTYFSGFSAASDHRSWVPFSADIWSISNPSQMFMSRMALGISTPTVSGILIEQGQYLSVWSGLESGGELREAGHLVQTELEYLKPYDVYDQLTPMSPLPGCGVVALGVGLFMNSRGAPQPAVAVEVIDAARYVAKKLPLPSDMVFMMSSASLDGAEYVGAVAATPSGPTAIVLHRAGCGIFEVLASAPLPAAPAWWTFPVDSSDTAEKNAGEALMAFAHGDAVAFCHFDGKRAFCFTYTVSTGVLGTFIAG